MPTTQWAICALAAMGLLARCAVAEDILRVVELRHADARYVAGLLGGAAVDHQAVTSRWATDVIHRAVSVFPKPRGEVVPDPRWYSYADVLPAQPPDEPATRFAAVFGLPELSQPPVAVPGRNALIVRGPAEVLDRVLEVVRFLDQPADMVNVDVRVEDAPTHIVRGWGVDFHTWGEGVDVGSAGNAPGDGPSLRWGYARSDLLASFPDQESRAFTMTGVNGTTTSGMPLDVAFGQVLPFFSAEVYYDAFGRRHVEYTPQAVFIGVELWCLPVVTGADLVRMTLRPTFSYYAGAVTSPRGQVVPIVSYQGVATTVTVPDGESLVIGGLRQVRDEANQRFEGLLHDVRVYDSSEPTMIVTPRILRPFPAE